jgi:hypothetical protein
MTKLWPHNVYFAHLFNSFRLVLYLDYVTLQVKHRHQISYAKDIIRSEIDNSDWSNCLI